DNNYGINSLKIESILQDEKSLEKFSSIISKIRSLYLRPPILVDKNQIAYWTLLHSKLSFSNIKIIQPSLHFLNYSKPLQMLKSIMQFQNKLVKPINTYISNNKCIKNNNTSLIVKGLSDYRTIVVDVNDSRLNWNKKPTL